MNIRNTGVTFSSITQGAGQVLLVFGLLAGWATLLLMALWPAGDPHPQTTAMFLAAQKGDLAAMDEILRDGLYVDSRDQTDMTPLIEAARTGQFDAVRRLLAAGAQIDACAPVYGTPLMAAVINGHYDVMRELIDCGANVDAVNPTGQTALRYARLRGDEEAVRILIAGGACAEGHAFARGEGEVIEHGGAVVKEKSGW